MQEEIDATPPDLWRTAQWLKACDLIGLPRQLPILVVHWVLRLG